MVETIRIHTCDQCGKTYTEGEPSDTMFPTSKWRTVGQHHCSGTGVMMFPNVNPIFCSFKCLSDWAHKQVIKETN